MEEKARWLRERHCSGLPDEASLPENLVKDFKQWRQEVQLYAEMEHQQSAAAGGNGVQRSFRGFVWERPTKKFWVRFSEAAGTPLTPRARDHEEQLALDDLSRADT